MADFDDVFAARPVPAMDIARRGEVDQAAIDAVNEELNYPSLQKLRRVLDKRGIAYNKKSLERLVKREATRQVQAPGYRYDGKIASAGIGDRWFADLIDFTAAPSAGTGKRTELRTTKDSESYILVVQDVFSRFIWTEALMTKTSQEVAKAFEKILQRAGKPPRTLTTDFGPEFEASFKTMLDANGIISFTKRPEDKNAIATIDSAIGKLKKSLVRDTRKLGTNDWASRLEKVTAGENNNPIDEYLEGQAPADVKQNKDLNFTLKKKNAEYASLNQERIKKRALALEEAKQFRPEQDRGEKFHRRGFKPTFGQMKQVKEVRGANVVDEEGKDYLTKLVKPVAESTEDAGPVRIEMRGSQLIDRTRRERLQVFADELVRFLRGKDGGVTTAAASKHLRQNPDFQIAMRNLPSFGAFVRLFDEFELVTSETSGGTSKVQLTERAPPRRRRLRTKRPDPNIN